MNAGRFASAFRLGRGERGLHVLQLVHGRRVETLLAQHVDSVLRVGDGHRQERRVALERLFLTNCNPLSNLTNVLGRVDDAQKRCDITLLRRVEVDEDEATDGRVSEGGIV